MKRNKIFTILSAALLVAASCVPENLQVIGENFISLSLSSKSMETKATMAGEDPFNENVIDNVYYFFYKIGETDTAPIVKGSLVGLGHKSGVRTEEIPVASNVPGALFEASDECQAFIVANPPQDLKSFLSGSPTLGELRSKLFVSALDGILDSFTMIFDSTAEKIASTGNILTLNANLKRLANKFTVSLNIIGRIDSPTEWKSVPADAKMEFHNAFSETSLEGDFALVRAGDSKFKEKLYSTGLIDFGEPQPEDGGNWTCRIERPAYSYSISWDFTGSMEPYLIIELPWQNVASGEVMPTYYKVFFSAKELTINNWCHLKIDLDRLGGFQKDHPVQLFENMDYMVLDWNDAFEDGSGITTDIDGARYLMMNQTEYFLYNQDTWNFPYTSSHECEIVLETYEKKNYRNRIAGIISGNSHDLGGTDIYNCTVDGSLITFHHSLNNDITTHHTEKNQIEEDIQVGSYDVVPYDFKFTIRHKDNYDYKQEVIVHQYPAIYIEAQPNSAGVELIYRPDIALTSFVHINSDLIEDIIKIITPYPDLSYNHYYGYGSDPQEIFSTSLGNSNGNMYVITTTTAPDLTVNGKPYMLGDPRQFESSVPKDHPLDPIPASSAVEHIWDLPYSGDDIFVDPDYTVNAIYGESPRSLTYYYPAKESSDVENIIAPKLRVASSWGQCSNMCYERAQRRCAAYQEDGYPAGRWRMPTAAEVMYICKLSSDHIIPMLFGQFAKDDAEAQKPYHYWCSTGLVGVYSSEKKDGALIDTYASPIYSPGVENATIRSAVRCVYDEWYWENRDYDNGTVATEKGRLPESLWGARYWGDMPR